MLTTPHRTKHGEIWQILCQITGFRKYTFELV